MFIRTALYFCGGFVGTNKGGKRKSKLVRFWKKGGR